MVESDPPMVNLYLFLDLGVCALRKTWSGVAPSLFGEARFKCLCDTCFLSTRMGRRDVLNPPLMMLWSNACKYLQ